MLQQLQVVAQKQVETLNSLYLYIYISYIHWPTLYTFLFFISACWFLLSRFIAHHVMFLFDSGSTLSITPIALSWLISCMGPARLERFGTLYIYRIYIYLQKSQMRKGSLFLCMYIHHLYIPKTIHTNKNCTFISVRVAEKGPTLKSTNFWTQSWPFCATRTPTIVNY